jgi:putative spermidine/putrescine transport system substrate-binding protein
MKPAIIRYLYCFLISATIFLTLSDRCPGQEALSWEETVAQARGATVDWYMWGGSPAVNSYVNGYLAKEIQDRYDITLRQVPVKDIAEVVGKLVVEKQAGKDSGGSVDLMWINGENFRTCKSEQLLHGPFTSRLPNNKYIDWTNPAVKNDFGTPVDGMEAPWGSAQMVMIYDPVRVPAPPRSVPELMDWIRSHPGRFTYPALPDFTGSVFVRHVFYSSSGSVDKWQGDYTEQELENGADATFKILREIRTSLWRNGTTYPESPVRMNTLFADGEIDFSFSYNQGEASRNIRDGLFPGSVRTYIFDEGTIANTHFVAIPFNARDKAAAMVVADFLLSPEAQLKKASPEVWGDFPAIDTTKLSAKWQSAFLALPRGEATLPDEELQSRQLPEPPGNILIYLERGWENKVLKNRQ